MSRVDDLLAELAPNGVRFQPLGSLGTRNKGTSITASKMKALALKAGPIRVFAGGKTIADVSEDAVPSKDVIRVPGIIVKSRGQIGFSYYEKPFTHKSELWSYSIDRADVDQKFIYYYLLTQISRLQDIARAKSVKLPQLSVRDTDTLQVPVPPLEVQREIVRVLDQFAQLEAGLEAELKAELEGRRRQSEYYREYLLASIDSGSVRWLPVREVLREPLANGRSVRDGDGYPVLRLSALRGPVVDVRDCKRGAWDAAMGSRFRIETGDIMMARGNGSKNFLARARMVIESTDVAFPDTMIRFRPNLNVISQRYFFYVWESHLVRSVIEQKAKASSGVWKISQDDLSSVVLPLPAMAEQERIVATLDQLDALADSLGLALLAELRARRKQYDYYRDKLLTFEESVE